MESATQHPKVKTRTSAVSTVDRPVEASVSSWLEWQCAMFKGVLHASLFSASASPTAVAGNTVGASPATGKLGSRSSSWPDDSIQPGLLEPVAEQAHQKNKSVCRSLSLSGKGKAQSPSSKSLLCLAIPIRLDGAAFVLVMVMTDRSVNERDSVIRLVQWGARWLSVVTDVAKPSKPVNQRILESVTAPSSFYARSMTLVMQLTEEMYCERVSLGWYDGSEIKVVAVSGVSIVDHRMQLVKDILLVMKECFDQKSPVQSTEQSSGAVNREHARLATSRGGGCCSIPIVDGESCIGVLLLEKNTNEPFYTSTINWCERLLTNVTPHLASTYESERSAFRKSFARMDHIVSGLIPGKFRRLRFISAVFLGLILIASVIEGTYTVTATATIEGRDKQVIVAPFDGFVLKATARSGETVEAGQSLAALDDRGLTVERDKWSSELNKIEKSYSHALATGDRLELRMLQSRRQEIEAEQALVNQKIERARLVAPFSGVIVKGDLSQKLGAPVEAGQVLYEVASADQYRLVLDVDEHQIARIAEESTARLRLNALPGQVHPISLNGMLPIARVVDGRNVFRYEAGFIENVADLRPGMRGYARLDAGRQSLLWIWTQGLMHRLSVMFWSMGF